MPERLADFSKDSFPEQLLLQLVFRLRPMNEIRCSAGRYITQRDMQMKIRDLKLAANPALRFEYHCRSIYRLSDDPVIAVIQADEPTVELLHLSHSGKTSR